MSISVGLHTTLQVGLVLFPPPETRCPHRTRARLFRRSLSNGTAMASTGSSGRAFLEKDVAQLLDEAKNPGPTSRNTEVQKTLQFIENDS